ncbi:hypothetical protein GGR21_002736 [Dysgonomonas hofstadii]|uniref:Uncharacterized protein n=1 Tax=Dysgonomonas hofstadii TaxID=637886 RepID=A0A840CY32_9BACT|nr:hypothetical protein [Dysgonomonas hofstadii]MBB4036823.1 hypothetical protein [Dysgonomonas hofstadii]
MKQAIFKLKQQTFRIAFLFITVCFFVVSGQAQVTIGSSVSPHDDALLDLKETDGGTSGKGLLLPRVSLTSSLLASPMVSHVEGMTIYNVAATADVTPGYYYNDGNKWVRLAIEDPASSKFFYMPSIVLPTDPDSPEYDLNTETFTVDLYNAYATQFDMMNPTSSVSNASATTSIPVLSSTDLDYYVIYYDNDVFENVQVTDAGVMTYKLVSGYTITKKTFMNIVFKEK